MAQQHRAVTLGRDGHPPGPQPVEHITRLAARALDPGGRAAGRGVVAGPVPVAAADRDSRGVPGQPPRERGGPALVEPAPVPDLGQRRAAPHRVGPADRPGERVVDRQQPAAGRGRLEPVVRLAPEVDPADVAQRTRVPAVGGQLLAGHQYDPVPPGHAGQLGVVADRVVVGDREEVQPAPGREHGQFGDGQRAIGVHRVRVQVTGQPLLSGIGRQVPPRWPLLQRRRRRGGGRQQPFGAAPRGLRRHPVRHPARRDAVHPDHHLPDPGLDLARQVSRRGGVAGDGEPAAGATRPAPEAARPEAAQVEHRAGRVVVGQLHPQPGRSRPDFHRQVMPGRLEPVLQRPDPGVHRARAVCVHPAWPAGSAAAARSASASKVTAGGSGGSPYRTANTCRRAPASGAVLTPG